MQHQLLQMCGLHTTAVILERLCIALIHSASIAAKLLFVAPGLLADTRARS